MASPFPVGRRKSWHRLCRTQVESAYVASNFLRTLCCLSKLGLSLGLATSFSELPSDGATPPGFRTPRRTAHELQAHSLKSPVYTGFLKVLCLKSSRRRGSSFSLCNLLFAVVYSRAHCRELISRIYVWIRLFHTSKALAPKPTAYKNIPTSPFRPTPIF
jgi:hypothetical protein